MLNTKIDLEDIINFQIESAEFLQAVNGLINPCNIINKESLRLAFLEINDEYCEQNNLCKTCRNELQEVNEHRGEHFGRESYDRFLVCLNGC